MNAFLLGPEEASFLASQARALALAARAVIAFAEAEPELASRAAVEIPALEARAILGRGAVERILAGSRSGVSSADFDDVSRLEGVMALADARIEAFEASLSQAGDGVQIGRLSEVLGIASTAVGLLNTVF